MLIQLENVSKSYLSEEIETKALQGVTLGIGRGEYVAIEGPSGCGKSTLLAVLGLLDTVTAGNYLLNGRRVDQLTGKDRAKVRNRDIGFVFQNFNLIGDLSIEENVALPLVYRGMSSAERHSRVHDALKRVHIAHRARHFPTHLSGGEQQRAAVARALAGDPAILLADEPTGNLDSANGEAVMELLSELNEFGSTIVVVTHDQRFARQAKRKISLLDGKVVDDLSPVPAF